MKYCQDVKVSIIMPSLNVAPYIEECLKSAVNQSLEDIEIICIDAGSTDGTREIIAEFEKKDNRIRCIDSEIRSYGYQVNVGIEAARGEYVAILETDDYVDTLMYEKLYNTATANNLDYVKADFDAFIELKGERLFFPGKMFADKDKYNRIIQCSSLPEIFVNDQNIWRGIYKKDFLKENSISLSETPGAAYQDIGFVLSVMTYAKRAMYIDDSFYRYRMQREGCSSCSDKILQFSYQEFKRLIDELMFEDTDTFKYVVQRMAGVFLAEYDKLLSKCDFVFEKNFYETFIDKYFAWFKDKLSEYISKGYISENDVPAADWKNLNILLRDSEEFTLLKKAEYEKKKEYINLIINKINNRNVVIVSCGIWGKKALDILLQRGVNVISFGDNNSCVWGTRIAGIEVHSLPECAMMYKDAVYVIANKKYEDELKQQLLDMGICAESIIGMRLTLVG